MAYSIRGIGILWFKKGRIAAVMALLCVVGEIGCLPVYGAQTQDRVVCIGYIDYDGFITEDGEGDYFCHRKEDNGRERISFFLYEKEP